MYFAGDDGSYHAEFDEFQFHVVVLGTLHPIVSAVLEPALVRCVGAIALCVFAVRCVLV